MDGRLAVRVIENNFLVEQKALKDKVAQLEKLYVSNIAPVDLVRDSGWIPVTDTWTYASASTITVPPGAASIYQKGDYIQWKQGAGYKYAVLSAVADTLLTIIVNTDYTVANAAITDVGYSHGGPVFGWPGWFNFTPTYTATGGSLTTVTTQVARYFPFGLSAKLQYGFTLVDKGTGTGTINVSSPLTATGRAIAVGRELSAGSMLQGPYSSGAFSIFNYANTVMLTNGYIYSLNAEIGW